MKLPNGHGPPPDNLDVRDDRSLGEFLHYIARVLYSDHGTLHEIVEEVKNFAVWKRSIEDDSLAKRAIREEAKRVRELRDRKIDRVKKVGEVGLVGLGISGGIITLVGRLL